MKIAMMTNSYKPFIAGVPVSIERLSRSLQARGHEVVVFAPSYDEQEEEKNVVRYKALLRGVACGFSVPDSLDSKIEKSFKEGNFDVIHVHHPMLIGRTAQYLSWKYHVPLVFTYHTRYEQYLHYVGLSGLKRVMPAYVKSYGKRCDMVLAPTPMMKDYLEEIGITAPVRVVPTGLHEDSFYPDRQRALGIRQHLAEDKKYLFCTVARLAKEKNLEFLFESMKLFKENCGSCFRLALIGDGPQRDSLEKRADSLGLSREIIFLGKIPNQEVKNYCHASDLFLFTSLSETQGIVLLESMAAGTPVLALWGSGTRDVVVNGKNGYMTEASETEFADKLMDILEKKEIELLRQGAVMTAENYSSEKIARLAESAYVEAVYDRMLKESRKYGDRNRNNNMVYSG
ncbi:glycosyltransferase family 4 protein [Parablautia intestinalis]|uniref:Glycosyltransferase family 4 protein n=1 Tax=Parablautia intestinalis TaxID=2320100 RepID=A0A3A9B2N0_9FIRM|nr:glycosyltransferase [Parablautia intestinalis]RKI94011.1 glycosyltransferase family 4 protein [Parablautia intestinalis]